MIIDATTSHATLLVEVGTTGLSSLSVNTKIKAVRKQFKKELPGVNILIFNNDDHSAVLIKSVVYN